MILYQKKGEQVVKSVRKTVKIIAKQNKMTSFYYS